jgi:hypothetical protein
MAYKQFENKTKKVLIFRQKSPINNGYEYFLTVMTKGAFGWNLNESYKQKLTINSEKQAIEIAKSFLEDDI